MTAQEMFEELGFTRKENKDYIHYSTEGAVYQSIFFNFSLRRVSLTKYDYNTNGQDSFDLYPETFSTLNAIQKQLEELGW